MSKEVERKALEKLEVAHDRNIKILKDRLVEKLFTIVNGKTSQGIYNVYKELLVAKGAKFTQKILTDLDYNNVNPTGWTTDDDMMKRALHNYSIEVNEEVGVVEREECAVSVVDELRSGIVQVGKVYVAKQRKLAVGDKMAGRQGNKGRAIGIVRDEDMPCLED